MNEDIQLYREAIDATQALIEGHYKHLYKLTPSELQQAHNDLDKFWQKYAEAKMHCEQCD